ncbi:ubiquitin carboxyl-terminal hydrolase, partial [Aphelenchoides avenae]
MAPKDDGLPYLHGHLLDEDADKLLEEEGDYLIQMKPDREGDRLVLAVKKSDSVHRMDVQRRNGSFSFQNKNFGSMKALVEHYQKKTIDCGGGKQLQLKRAKRTAHKVETKRDVLDNLDENGHRYVGLVNQAKTCYLNSLIQTLYMTPESRNAIYAWKFNGNSVDETKNITFQLQKLFLLLQSSDKSSLETTDLTASLGWQSSEAHVEHDVQEFCGRMFDALEQKWRKEPGLATLIQDLYKGTVQNWRKCLKCETERVTEEAFLDLSLAVRPFGATKAHKSV